MKMEIRREGETGIQEEGTEGGRTRWEEKADEEGRRVNEGRKGKTRREDEV